MDSVEWVDFELRILSYFNPRQEQFLKSKGNNFGVKVFSSEVTGEGAEHLSSNQPSKGGIPEGKLDY